MDSDPTLPPLKGSEMCLDILVFIERERKLLLHLSKVQLHKGEGEGQDRSLTYSYLRFLFTQKLILLISFG